MFLEDHQDDVWKDCASEKERPRPSMRSDDEMNDKMKGEEGSTYESSSIGEAAKLCPGEMIFGLRKSENLCEDSDATERSQRQSDSRLRAQQCAVCNATSLRERRYLQFSLMV